MRNKRNLTVGFGLNDSSLGAIGDVTPEEETSPLRFQSGSDTNLVQMIKNQIPITQMNSDDSLFSPIGLEKDNTMLTI